MSWFDRLLPPKIKARAALPKKRSVPEGLWQKCNGCAAVLYASELKRNLQVCPECSYHMPLSARDRLQAFFDDGLFHEIGLGLQSIDHLRFRDTRRYRERILEAKRETKEDDALIAAEGTLKMIPIVATAFEFRFMGGSMGSVVGERFVRAAERGLKLSAPVVCFTASGGARMQEGLVSLMQMAKVAAVLNRLRESNIPFVSVLTNPTMGGVSASVAMLGDFVFAEPNALIGFAGPRVIEQTVREELPEGFQRSEFLMEHGAIDKIVDRRELPTLIHSLIETLGFEEQIETKSELVLPDE